MSVRRALESFVMANPGSKLREIAHGCGITDRKAITNAGAQLAQMVNFGRLHAEKPIGQFHGLQYYPTELSGQYKPRPTAEEIAANTRAREERKRFKAKQRRLTAAQQQAFYSTAPQPPARSTAAPHDPLQPPARPAKPGGGGDHRRVPAPRRSHPEARPLRNQHAPQIRPQPRRRPEPAASPCARGRVALTGERHVRPRRTPRRA